MAATLLFALLGEIHAAPLGTAFTYQGQLTLGGSPVTDLYDFEVRLYDAEAGGAQLGSTVTAIDVEVEGGLFVLDLDFGQAVFEGDEALWLEISTRPAGTSTWTDLTPRQPLHPTPYALRSQSQAWSGLTGVPSGFADNVDDDTIAALSCAPGETAQWNGASWNCSSGGSGDITSVQTGPGCGLTGGADSGDVDLCISFSFVQRRITGSCPPGSAIRQVNQNGTVVCTVPNPGGYAVVDDTGWFSVPNQTRLEIDLGSADYDFVFGVIRGGNGLSGPIYQPVMGSIFQDYLRAYVGLSGTGISVNNYRYVARTMNLGDWNDLTLAAADLRLTAIDRTADYDSGWQTCSAGITYVFNHGLGTDVELAIVEVAENSDGTGWRLPTMSSSNNDGSAWRQTNIVAFDNQNVTLRTHGNLARFRETPGGPTVSPTSGFCRVQLFSWTPAYDSGWVPLSTALGNRDKWLRHNLGSIPRIFMLWVAQNADGSGWRLPAMSNSHRSGSYGTQVYNLTDNWATIKGGMTCVAQFINGAGNSTCPTSGYVRFMA